MTDFNLTNGCTVKKPCCFVDIGFCGGFVSRLFCLESKKGFIFQMDNMWILDKMLTIL